MKKLSFLLLFLPLICFADVDTKDGTAITTTNNQDGFTSNVSKIDGQTVVSGGSGPPAGYVAYYKLDAAGGTNTEQFYNEVSEAWEGSDADEGAFVTGQVDNAYENDTAGEEGYIPGSNFSHAQLTVYFYYKANNAGAQTVFPVRLHNSFGSDRLYFYHYYENDGSDRGRVEVRTDTDANNTIVVFNKPSDAEWHEVYVTIDMTGQELNVYIDGADAAVSTSYEASLNDWGTITDDVMISHLAANTTNRYCVIDELRIYDSIVTP